jgi:hypothetical protein
MLPSKTEKIDKTFLPLSKSKGRDNKQVIIAFPTLKKHQYQESHLIDAIEIDQGLCQNLYFIPLIRHWKCGSPNKVNFKIILILCLTLILIIFIHNPPF